MKIRRYISSGRTEAVLESLGYYFIPAIILTAAGIWLNGLWQGFGLIYAAVSLMFLTRWIFDFFLHYVKFGSESAEVRDGSTRHSVSRLDMLYAEPVAELRRGTFSCSRLKRCDKIAVYDRSGRMLFYVSDSPRARDYLKNELKLLFFQRSNI